MWFDSTTYMLCVCIKQIAKFSPVIGLRHHNMLYTVIQILDIQLFHAWFLVPLAHCMLQSLMCETFGVAEPHVNFAFDGVWRVKSSFQYHNHESTCSVQMGLETLKRLS